MGSKNRLYMDIMAMHNEVTGSLNLCVLKLPNGETKRFIVDCGLFQESEYSEWNTELLFTPEKVDFVLITHNHVDHIGKLPYIVKKGFRGNVFCSKPTGVLMYPALYDSQKVLSDVAKRNHTAVMYEEKDVAKTLGFLNVCEFEEQVDIDENIKATFFYNGHLIGAAIILVQIKYPEYEDMNILFTGDYNNKNKFFDVKPLPEWVLNLPLTIVQESTYGNMDSTEIKQTLQNNVINCLEKGGTVVEMVFALGRLQEVLYDHKCMQGSGVLDVSIPIYVDGKLGFKYTNLFCKANLGIKEEMLDFIPENCTFVDSDIRNFLLNDTNPKIILTTSGMGSYGPAQMYIPEYITRENALLQFTGYTAEGTLGYRLKTTEIGETVNIGAVLVKKRAQVEYTTEYSAHAKADEMIQFLQGFSNLKLVLINHGEMETKEIFANRVLNEVNTKRVGILDRRYFFRITPYGFEKTLPTKFM